MAIKPTQPCARYWPTLLASDRNRLQLGKVDSRAQAQRVGDLGYAVGMLLCEVDGRRGVA